MFQTTLSGILKAEYIVYSLPTYVHKHYM